MDRVSDNNNLIDIRKIGLLVNTTSYCEKFCFGGCDIHCLMNHLDDWTIVNIDVSYQYDDLILYTGIQYNNYHMWIC